uniref:Thiosulfate sulfurtransferase/rhodanese-like domain-containing protein 2 n=1 Tax=Callorhinchus milii TaxID=7868 RepID=A0A4W3HJF6_CALMI|eukprot:gi/632962252/ref/XP_007897204.1/ PREDICTED: thiosulfate sulfurtransferase/rhodanese-like domain-containing protein 2 [Callorhinchus milii]
MDVQFHRTAAGNHRHLQRKDTRAAMRRAFSLFIKSRQAPEASAASAQELDVQKVHWECCGQQFEKKMDIHKHAAKEHMPEVLQQTEAVLELLVQQNSKLTANHNFGENKSASLELSGTKEEFDVCAWLPDTSHVTFDELTCEAGEVLLYYCYCAIEEPRMICTWQTALCRQLHLTGKVRIGTEGINGTIGGCKTATELYIQAMISHPLFQNMSKEDFKRSAGGVNCFADLRVGVFKEIVPMGVDPEKVSYKDAGTHLTPEEFHMKVEALSQDLEIDKKTILLDCRNFYESKIGNFQHSLAPNIRKFSYFPDYVDRNLEFFRGKQILMYCTGGIRCERGSAYLRSKGVCKEVYQLKGGIHKYLEQFPSGFYKGKLFVFDDRYTIPASNGIISECSYCGTRWDQYRLCSTSYCCQLVLSCLRCREKGLVACCLICQEKGKSASESHSGAPVKEECDCTEKRMKIPVEHI